MHSPVVYFIYAPHCRAIKIGTTTDIAERLDSLQHAHPDKLILLGTIPGDHKEELKLHIEFDHLRRLGEWFTDAYELQHYITQICGRYDALKAPALYLESNIVNAQRQSNSDTIAMSNLMKVLVFCCPQQKRWEVSAVMSILSAGLGRPFIHNNETRRFLKFQSWQISKVMGEEYYTLPFGVEPDSNKELIELATQLFKNIWKKFEDEPDPLTSMPSSLQELWWKLEESYEIDKETVQALLREKYVKQLPKT